MKRIGIPAFFLFLTGILPQGVSQVVLSGKIQEPCFPGGEKLCHGGILVFASLDGPLAEARPFRTWETDPAGWYRISGSAGSYTILFSTPARFLRPILLTNIPLTDGEAVERDVSPRHDFASYSEKAWDERPAREYDQLFTARGTSVTSVGFKLASDGVDGFGPGSQNLVLSIHRKGPGSPEAWEEVGPAMPVLGVDCGGGKSYSYSAGWCSGEVPLVPGETYAVRLRAERPEGTFQAFWRPCEGGAEDCYRVDPQGKGAFQGRSIWMAVGADSDGILIPYQKRVHREFQEFAGFRSKWSQTYVARGRSLAGAILYAAVGGTQPPLSRQRAAVRVRRGGPEGPLVGTEKIAVGNGNYTGDASWGTFGAAFAPGEVPLEPGETYALEFESIESAETLRGFVNIKGQTSDERPGFNPYRKCPPDTYPQGTAYAGGAEARDFDLDLQILEYEFASRDWGSAVAPEDLLQKGGGDWKTFSCDPGTAHQYITESPAGPARILRVTGVPEAKAVDGGFVRKAEGLSRAETYRIEGRLRASWPVDLERRCSIGHDPTGQTEDPKAPTIVWTTLPPIHGIFVPYRSPPVRPAKGSLSIWLRGRAASPISGMPFRADFGDFTLRRVRTDAPKGTALKVQTKS